MIKAQELRIGNHILKNGKLHYVNHLTIRDIYGLSVDDTDNFEPIPLTEEWLLKFGFEFEYRHKHKKSYVLWDGSIPKIRAVFIGSDIHIFVYDKLLSHIKHIHQLQNLHYDLFDSELIYKINENE